jgi:hypothetical protein
MQLQATTGWDWVPFLFTATAAVRLAMLPLMVNQLKNMSALAPVAPSILTVGKSLKASPIAWPRKVYLFVRGTVAVLHASRIRVYRTFIYNIAYFWFMALSIFALRRVVS